MTGQYGSTTRTLVARYADLVRPEFSRGVGSACTAGAWGLAVSELASALALDGIAVTGEDQTRFRELPGRIELSPDTPADLADRLRVEPCDSAGLNQEE